MAMHVIYFEVMKVKEVEHYSIEKLCSNLPLIAHKVTIHQETNASL